MVINALTVHPEIFLFFLLVSITDSCIVHYVSLQLLRQIKIVLNLKRSEIEFHQIPQHAKKILQVSTYIIIIMSICDKQSVCIIKRYALAVKPRCCCLTVKIFVSNNVSTI